MRFPLASTFVAFGRMISIAFGQVVPPPPPLDSLFIEKDQVQLRQRAYFDHAIQRQRLELLISDAPLPKQWLGNEVESAQTEELEDMARSGQLSIADEAQVVRRYLAGDGGMRSWIEVPRRWPVGAPLAIRVREPHYAAGVYRRWFIARTTDQPSSNPAQISIQPAVQTDARMGTRLWTDRVIELQAVPPSGIVQLDCELRTTAIDGRRGAFGVDDGDLLVHEKLALTVQPVDSVVDCIHQVLATDIDEWFRESGRFVLSFDDRGMAALYINRSGVSLQADGLTFGLTLSITDSSDNVIASGWVWFRDAIGWPLHEVGPGVRMVEAWPNAIAESIDSNGIKLRVNSDGLIALRDINAVAMWVGSVEVPSADIEIIKSSSKR